MSNGFNLCSNFVSMPAAGSPDIDRMQSHEPGIASRLGELYGASAPMKHLFSLIEKVAPTRANVLISGESGTGKELVAGEIHRLSRERDKPFVAINCGAVSPQLIEAELFGHERGSFTGAVRMHRGCFERAAGGTLFLDELTEMSPEMQIKLLRVLETGRFCRVGADDEIKVRVRVVAATNRDPQQAVEAGLLRSDLYYRLSVFPITMPNLRERGEDVELLARLFLERLNDEEECGKTLSRSSRRFLREYHWPGNVRELKNVVHRAFILADQELDLSQAVGPSRPLVAPVATDCITFPLGSKLADAEQRLIFATLGYCGGNKTQTAEVLGVSLKTLYNRLNEYQARMAGSEAPTAPPPPYSVNANM